MRVDTLNSARLEHGRAINLYVIILAFERDALVVRRKGHLIELVCSRLEGMTHKGYKVTGRGRGAERWPNEHNDPREHSRREVTKRESEHHISWGTERRPACSCLCGSP